MLAAFWAYLAFMALLVWIALRRWFGDDLSARAERSRASTAAPR